MSNSSAAAVSERSPRLTLTDRIDMIKNNRYFPIVFPLAMLAVLLLLFVALTGGEFMKRSVILGIFNQSFITGTMATAVALVNRIDIPGFLLVCRARRLGGFVGTRLAVSVFYNAGSLGLPGNREYGRDGSCYFGRRCGAYDV